MRRCTRALCATGVVTITHACVPAGSIDGFLSFWKKKDQAIEFVKKYRAHLGAVDCLAVSADGSLCASLSHDGSVKVRTAALQAESLPSVEWQIINSLWGVMIYSIHHAAAVFSLEHHARFRYKKPRTQHLQQNSKKT